HGRAGLPPSPRRQADRLRRARRQSGRGEADPRAGLRSERRRTDPDAHLPRYAGLHPPPAEPRLQKPDDREAGPGPHLQAGGIVAARDGRRGACLRYSPHRMRMLSAALLFLIAAPLLAQQQSKMKPEETEVWKPVPPVVTPGAKDSDPPSDAIVLFDGKDESQWVSAQDHTPAQWVVADGVLTVNKNGG